MNFPFIYIPQETKCHQLREEQSFLYLVVMAVSSKAPEQRQGLGRDIKRLITQHITSEHECNIAFLLGLLVLLTWLV